MKTVKEMQAALDIKRAERLVFEEKVSVLNEYQKKIGGIPAPVIRKSKGWWKTVIMKSCPLCGSELHCQRTQGKSIEYYDYYSCSSSKCDYEYSKYAYTDLGPD